VSNDGFAQDRLARMRSAMAGHVERGALPGLVALVARRGETHAEAIGAVAVGGAPMQRDAIFRIASITKPIVAAAAMTLVEECVLRLDDPVDGLLPELADRTVLRAFDGPLADTVPAHRPITLRDLLTFRLGYGVVFAPTPFAAAMAEAGLVPGGTAGENGPDEYLRRLGALPLAHQPGERWLYGHGANVLGILIARATGRSLGAVLQERIFAPLGMADTAFSVPANKLDRLATAYRTNPESGQPEVIAGADGPFARPPAFEAGAGGLVSTAADLLAFGEMMLGGGEFRGNRVLSRPAVALMTTDQITPGQKAASPFFPGFWDTRGWGFGLAVVTRRDGLADTPGRYGWFGGGGASWYVDPHEELIGVLLTQLQVDSPHWPAIENDFWVSAYQALAD
jgi:CubicO group peptidase (beta-lactamase class C family)